MASDNNDTPSTGCLLSELTSNDPNFSQPGMVYPNDDSWDVLNSMVILHDDFNSDGGPMYSFYTSSIPIHELKAGKSLNGPSEREAHSNHKGQRKVTFNETVFQKLSTQHSVPILQHTPFLIRESRPPTPWKVLNNSTNVYRSLPISNERSASANIESNQ